MNKRQELKNLLYTIPLAGILGGFFWLLFHEDLASPFLLGCIISFIGIYITRLIGFGIKKYIAGRPEAILDISIDNEN